jgi:hypothetical protein
MKGLKNRLRAPSHGGALKEKNFLILNSKLSQNARKAQVIEKFRNSMAEAAWTSAR